MGHLKSFRCTGVRWYDEISAIYTFFNHSQDRRPVESDVIAWKKCKWMKLRLTAAVRWYNGATEGTEMVSALECFLWSLKAVWNFICSLNCKGQLISKGLFGDFIWTKNRTKNFCPEDIIFSWVRAPLKKIYFLFNLFF